jgi:hypothetical protein
MKGSLGMGLVMKQQLLPDQLEKPLRPAKQKGLDTLLEIPLLRSCKDPEDQKSVLQEET